MAMPPDVPVIDLMMGLPEGHKKDWYGFLRKGFMDEESKDMEFPAQYMFKEVPKDIDENADPISVVLAEMDHFNIQKAMLGIGGRADVERGNAQRALKEHPDRFFASYEVDPNRGMEGPRVPMLCQKTELLDEVCWFFPELRVVMRHGAEPWDALAVKLMLKWPNLHYSTSAFSPKYYPKTVIDFANTRGTDKVMYAGYFPMGLSLERIFKDMQDVPFRDHVWPKFLHENATRVFKL
jgi:predicted TIM-barrel fold metal-dependent hydrolase